MTLVNLICTSCEKEYSLQTVYPRCLACGEPLEVHYPQLKKDEVFQSGGLLHRYSNYLPFDQVHDSISLGEGNTPLIKSTIVASKLGLRSLYFKNEAQNPTGSFKDRGTVAGLEHALSLGFERIGTVSTGNMAASVAAYGARAGLRTLILVSRAMPQEKLAPIAIYGSRILKVEGDYGDLYFASLEIGREEGIYFINSDVPFRVEGSKTIAYEICEQLEFKVPDYVVIPVSAGGNIRGIIKGFEEFRAVGLIERIPSFIAAQASGCSPIVDAFQQGEETIKRIDNPHTIAHAIENPFPPSGNGVLRKLRQHGGSAINVNDEEILATQKLLAREGIFGQPAAAVPLAAVKKLLKRGIVNAEESIVCIVTGSGLVLQQQRFEFAETTIRELHHHIRNMK